MFLFYSGILLCLSSLLRHAHVHVWHEQLFNLEKRNFGLTELSKKLYNHTTAV